MSYTNVLFNILAEVKNNQDVILRLSDAQIGRVCSVGAVEGIPLPPAEPGEQVKIPKLSIKVVTSNRV